MDNRQGNIAMRSRIQILMTLLAMCIGAARATGATIPDDKAVIPFETRLGIVTFQHGMHAGLSIAECITCHHTWEGSGPVKACHECHANKDAEAPAAKKAFHTRCIGCHEYTVAEGMEAGRPKKMQALPYQVDRACQRHANTHRHRPFFRRARCTERDVEPIS
jgi:hypothetical protein